MKTTFRLAVGTAVLLLTATAGPAVSSPGSGVAPRAATPSEPGDAVVSGSAVDESPAAAAGALTTDSLDPKTQAERPDAFWWQSPEEVLQSLYGTCGVRDCCKFCVKGKACGDTCIERADTCRVGCGCACQKPLFFGE